MRARAIGASSITRNSGGCVETEARTRQRPGSRPHCGTVRETSRRTETHLCPALAVREARKRATALCITEIPRLLEKRPRSVDCRVSMGLVFRKTIGRGPFRWTVSKRGVGWSVGIPGLRYGVSASGQRYLSVGIPSTGFYWIKHLGKPIPSAPQTSQPVQPVPAPPPSSGPREPNPPQSPWWKQKGLSPALTATWANRQCGFASPRRCLPGPKSR